MNISVGEGVEDLDDEGVNNGGVDSSLSPPILPMLSPLNGDLDRNLSAMGGKELNLNGGEIAILLLDAF